VGVVQQVLSPGVQDREKADLGAQVLRIGGDGAQRFGAGVKQQVVDEPLVLVGDRRDRLWDGEHDVEVLDIKQFGLPVLEPLRAGERLALRTRPMPARNGVHPIKQRIFGSASRRLGMRSAVRCWSPRR
jgi:hypothetical protein